jgi:hypothetical protein
MVQPRMLKSAHAVFPHLAVLHPLLSSCCFSHCHCLLEPMAYQLPLACCLQPFAGLYWLPGTITADGSKACTADCSGFL